MELSNQTSQELLRRARMVAKGVAAKYSIELPTVNPAKVPLALIPLVPHAEVLGIGDDLARDEVVEVMSPEYLHFVRVLVGEHSAALREWYLPAEFGEARHSEECAAVGWMLRALNIIL